VAGVWCDTREASGGAGDTEIYGAVVDYRALLKTNDLGVKIPWSEIPVGEE